jgi:erythromycin esterase-like protein
MTEMVRSSLIENIRRAAVSFEETTALARLIKELSGSRIVLLGEATHGTHDFYALRAEITKKLISDHGFTVVAVEADWPDALQLNSWVRSESAGNEVEAVSTFSRFPWWMWRNQETAELIAWMRGYNSALRRNAPKVGFYGLDLYSATSSRGSLDGVVPGEEFFIEEQNARLARNAIQYFRAVQSGYPSSWNLRDRHMTETLEALLAFLDQYSGKRTRAVVWAHNSHVGDARATQLSASGELNLGQLLRERHGAAVKLVGFTTYRGTVIAASEWGARPGVENVRPAALESYEALFHRARIPKFWLDPKNPLVERLSSPRLERAIGAVYVHQAELENHYFHAELPKQFDLVVHLDETEALHPIEGPNLTKKEARCAK